MTKGRKDIPPACTAGWPDEAGQALEALYRREEPGLRRYFRRRLRNDDDALECVQETFTRLLSAWRGRTPSEPTGYLRRIAMNLMIDRTRPGRPIHCTLSVEIATAPEQEHSLLAEDVMETYQSVLDSLPDRTRTVFLLYRVEEMKYREIAEQMGISIPAVQKHMARALERLTLALNGTT